VLERHTERCMGDTEVWLAFQDPETGKDYFTIFDPDASAIAFDAAGTAVFEQLHHPEWGYRTIVRRLPEGEQLDRAPAGVEPEIDLRDWQAEHGATVLRAAGRRFWRADADLERRAELDGARRDALLDRLLARDPCAEAWSDLMDLLVSWPGGLGPGLAGRVAQRLAGWPDGLRLLLRWMDGTQPAELLRLLRCYPESLDRSRVAFSPGQLRNLVAHPGTGRLGAVVLQRCSLEPGAVAELLAAPDLSSLRHLDLAGNGLAATDARALAGSARLQQLEVLWLRDNRLGDEGVAALASTQTLPALRLLDLGNNDVGCRGAKALAAWPQLAALRRLDLDANRIGDAGAVALASSPRLAGLALLEVQENDFGRAGARAIAEAPYRRDLLGVPVEAPDLRRITQSAVPADDFDRWQRGAVHERGREVARRAPEQLVVRTLALDRWLLRPTVVLACEVLEVERSEVGLQPGDLVTVVMPRSQAPPHPPVPDERELARSSLRWRVCDEQLWKDQAAVLDSRFSPTRGAAEGGRRGFLAAEAGPCSFSEGRRAG